MSKLKKNPSKVYYYNWLVKKKEKEKKKLKEQWSEWLVFQKKSQSSMLYLVGFKKK